MNKMLAFLKDSVVFTAGAAVLDRVPSLDIIGKLRLIDVDAQVIEVTKAK